LPGASREAVVETSLTIAALRAGGAAIHGAMAVRFFIQTDNGKKRKFIGVPSPLFSGSARIPAFRSRNSAQSA
jgi:hypothetical protein